MEIHTKFSLLLLLLVIAAAASATSTSADSPSDSSSRTTAAAAAAPTTTNPFDFIRSCCNATLYPDVCYTSLSRYANAVYRDPAHLALVAIGVSLAWARRASDYFSKITHRADYGPDPRAAAALRDCSSAFGDAVDQMRGSLKQMRHLGMGPAGSDGRAEAVRFQLSNVQTWMSAALTNEDTCSDGFADVPNSCPVKADVCDRVSRVTKLTSNALALVNSFANSMGS